MPDGPAETPYDEPPRLQPSSKLARMVPVFFVLCTITGLYTMYTLCHLLPLLQLSVQPEMVNKEMYTRGLIETGIFHGITLLLLLCYARCVLVHPGEVPNAEPWLYTSTGSALAGFSLKERKAGGERRHCKWCGKYKPDRCHHCRTCGTCILKMDHHCPWIYNCVGFHNYKYFFLLLFYTMLDTHFIVWTMTESLVRAVDENAHIMTMFFTLFGLTLAFFLGSLATPFFGFHVWLMCMGMTTIEFCEKHLPKRSAGGQQSGDCCTDCFNNDSVFNLGCWGNVTSTLGHNPLLWLLPFTGSQGDGLTYRTLETEAQNELGYGQESASKAAPKTLFEQAAFWANYGATTPAAWGQQGKIQQPVGMQPRSFWTG